MAVIRGEHVVMFHCKGVTIFSRLLDGRFPKWRGIIPKMDSADSLRAQVQSGELLKAIKALTWCPLHWNRVFF
jgi:DNA polymerase III sliding clamp (beta) subunit (PCNA family)